MNLKNLDMLNEEWEVAGEIQQEQLIKEIISAVKDNNAELFNKKGKVLCESKVLRDLIISELEKRKDILDTEKDSIIEEICNELVTKCLLAVGEEFSDRLMCSLQRIKYFKDWHYDSTTSITELKDLIKTGTKYDVLVIGYRFPSVATVLPEIIRLFNTSRIILLAGDKESDFNLIEQAKAHGLKNIVTGRVPETPGDKPYTLPVALMYDLKDVIQPEEPEPKSVERMEQGITTVAQDAPRENITPAGGNRRRLKINRKIRDVIRRDNGNGVPDTINQSLKTEKSTHEDSFTEQEVVEPLVNQFLSHDNQGILVVSSSNKGGVGKTTITVSIAEALARANIKTCVVDFNFGGPNIHAFYKVTGVPGIEALAKYPFSSTLIDDLLVKVNDSLYVLPGIMDATNPIYEKGVLGKTLDYLKSQFPVVMADTPPEFWTDDRLTEVFGERANLVLGVMEQSKYCEEEAMVYAPKFIQYGVTPDKILLILNKYDPDLPERIEEKFNSRLIIKDKKSRPRVVAKIPSNYRAFAKSTYDGTAVNIDYRHNQIHVVAETIANRAGYSYEIEYEKVGQSNEQSFLEKLKNKLPFGFRKGR